MYNLFSFGDIKMSVFQFLDSTGKVVCESGINTKRATLILQAVGLMIQHECDITITRYGHFFDRVKFKSAAHPRSAN